MKYLLVPIGEPFRRHDPLIPVPLLQFARVSQIKILELVLRIPPILVLGNDHVPEAGLPMHVEEQVQEGFGEGHPLLLVLRQLHPLDEVLDSHYSEQFEDRKEFEVLVHDAEDR